MDGEAVVIKETSGCLDKAAMVLDDKAASPSPILPPRLMREHFQELGMLQTQILQETRLRASIPS